MSMIVPAGVRDDNYAQALRIVRTRTQWVLSIVGLVALLISPLLLDDYINNLLCLICINIITVLGLNLLTGYCGQISLGQSAFMGMGAYTSGIIYAKFGLPFWSIAFFCAIITSAISGLIVGMTSVRIKGFYLALSTVAFQFIFNWVLFRAANLTNGGRGLSIPPVAIGSLLLDSRLKVAYLCIVSVIILTYFAKNIARTGLGRSFIAVRDNDLAAEVMGINLARTKLIAFLISSVYGGFAGVLYAVFFRWLMPDLFTLIESVWSLAMVIVGGMGSILGSILGPIFIICLQEGVRILFADLAASFPSILSVGMATGVCNIIVGLAVVLFLVFEPRGLSHRWEMFKAAYRFWPFSY